MTSNINQKALKAVLLLCLFCPAKYTFALTGNEWNGISKDAQEFYVAGVIDGFRNALSLCKQLPGEDCVYAEVLSAPVMCFSKSPYVQMVAMVRKYMEDSPTKWHYDMASNIYVALDQACKAEKRR